MTALEVDFVLYLGDPDEGAQAVDSRTLVKDLPALKDSIDADSPYGGLVVRRDGKQVLDPRPDPIVPLVTHLLKAVPYVLDGEQESVLLSESEHGITLAGGPDDVAISFFAGDEFEPDELLLPATPMPLGDFGEQFVGMGERLKTAVQGAAPDLLSDGSFDEFLELASDAVKKYKLEVDRGLRSL